MTPPPDSSLRQLHYFSVLAEELHYGKAAARLAISQPALTRQIQGLERSVGTALVERTQRSVQLTPAGAAFAAGARETLEHHSRAVDAARNVAARRSDSLSIGFESCAPYHDFPAVLKQYVARYPRTRISSYQMSGPEQADALERHRIDIGFVHPPVPDDAAFAFEPVAEEQFVVAVPSSHRLASRKRVPTAQLAEERFVLFPRALAPGCYDAILRVCHAAGFRPNVAHEANRVAAALQLIPAAGAVALFPECVGRERATGVTFRELTGSVTTVTSGFLRRSGAVALPVERFLDLWRSMKKLPADDAPPTRKRRG